MSMGALFSIYAGWYYWIGKMTGKQYPQFTSKLHFWLTFIGVNLVFFPQHFLGLAGMPRRIPDYPDAYALWNYVSTMGYAVTAIGVVVFLIGIVQTFRSKERVGENQWGEGATTLEWTLSSPPPFHQFEKLPRIK